MRSFIVLLRVSILLMIFTLIIYCSKNNPTTPDEGQQLEKDISTVTSLQDANGILYQRLKAEGIPDSMAVDSLVSAFKANSAVSWAIRTSQGVAIQYKSGINGGIMTDPLDDPSPGDSIFLDSLLRVLYPGLGKKSTISSRVTAATAKPTIFINPSYACRQMYANVIRLKEPKLLAQTCHNAPVVILGQDATVDRFASLSGYGYIHIYSHGWRDVNPTTGIEYVWCMTGENKNLPTLLKYPKEDWSIVTYYNFHDTINGIECDKGDRIFISPRIIANSSTNFSNDSTIIYGGFCFSGLGSWGSTIIDSAHAAAYIGFNWSVLTVRNASWSLKFLGCLTDTNRITPMTVEKSFIEMEKLGGTYYPDDETDPKKRSPTGQVCLLRFGLPSAHLWRNIGDIVMDIDGNMYHTVTIGTQTWLVENLKTTRFNDGTPIPLVTDSASWVNLTTPGYCWYNNDIKNKEPYGALYNWYTVNTGKLAIKGWHVPTDSEWTVLEKYLVLNGYNSDGTTDTSKDNKIAKSLAAKTDWYTSRTTGAIGCDLSKNNSSGFSALPGGSRYFHGSFDLQSLNGYWWSATEFDASDALSRGLSFDYETLFRSYYDYKSGGFSVRLVRD